MDQARFWDVDFSDSEPSAVWMLVDVYHSYRVLAYGGLEGLHPGESAMPAEDVARWLEEHRSAWTEEVLLIPIRNEIWLVLTHFYLSCGCYLLTRMPALPSDPDVLAKWIVLSGVTVYPEMPPDLPCYRLAYAADDSEGWMRVLRCLPRPSFDVEDREEIKRLTDAVASLMGIHVISKTVKEESPPQDGDIFAAKCDFHMWAVMLMLSIFSLRKCGVRCVSVYCKAVEEGTALILTASDVDPEACPEQSEGMRFCHRLAQNNAQIFSCLTFDGMTRLIFCSVRKNYALLGVKIPAFLSDVAQEMSEQDGEEG